jgi:hypothetical protein
LVDGKIFLARDNDNGRSIFDNKKWLAVVDMDC